MNECKKIDLKIEKKNSICFKNNQNCHLAAGFYHFDCHSVEIDSHKSNE